MKVKSTYHLEVDNATNSTQLNWFYAVLYAGFWILLYFAVVSTQTNRLPQAVERKDERPNETQFVAERAESILVDLLKIGPRVVGSVANEFTVIEFLNEQISKIQAQASDSYEFELDIAEFNGGFIHWSMLNMYQSIQNVIVKLKSRNSTSENYLLINSHYDSAPTSPGAGDDGSMVAVMLELMRVISKTERTLEHPIIFLFNGAEENPLQASHAFITQHRWANHCKAVINLDAAGSGGREILFQSGPGHPWLMNYYRQVPHPFANSLAEEIFQAGMIPSDTDFRIFHQFGNIPGLDLAYVSNGYVYHTEYDGIEYVTKSSLQHTGDNLLTLAIQMSNAPEMYNISQHNGGHVIYYDVLGWFFITYNEDTGTLINASVCTIALITSAIYMYLISNRNQLPIAALLHQYIILFIIQAAALIFGAALILAIGYLLEETNRSMSWYTETWLLGGLFFAPMFASMSAIPGHYLHKHETNLPLIIRVQLLINAHCLILIFLTIVVTAMGIRTAYNCTISICFSTIALILRMLTNWRYQLQIFILVTMASHILPFIYYTSSAQSTYLTMIPMMGRSGVNLNSDILMGMIAIFYAILSVGSIMPVFFLFRKARFLWLVFLSVTCICIAIAYTPIGFPYRPKTSAQRYSLIHVQRILKSFNNSVRIMDSGIYMFPQDRNFHTADEYIQRIGEKREIRDFCNVEMFCGMPVFNHRWHKDREFSYWIPIDERPITPTKPPNLTLKNAFILKKPNRKRFEFALNGIDHMTIFVDLKNDAYILDWSFNKTMIEDNWKPPYFIYLSFGKHTKEFTFTIDVEMKLTQNESLEIGIGGHWIHQQIQRTEKHQQLINSFPNYFTVTDWVAAYETWLF